MVLWPCAKTAADANNAVRVSRVFFMLSCFRAGKLIKRR
jgi:hypothetical protein